MTTTVNAGPAAGWPKQPDTPYYGRTDGSPLNTRPTGSVVITGVATEGEVLTASSTLADADTIGTLSYQWVNDVDGNVGTNSSTYTIQSSDVGDTVHVVVSYTDGSAQAESYTSDSTTIIDGTPGGQYFANGDVNWQNPPTLPPLAPINISNTSDVLIEFGVIDMATNDAIVLDTVVGVVIENVWIKNCGNRGIVLLSCKCITVRNCRITDTNGNEVQYQGQAIFMDFCQGSLLVESNWFENNSSAITNNVGGDFVDGMVRGNYCKNPKKLPNKGGGNFIANNWCDLMAGFTITENVMNGDLGVCDVEDWISNYRSSGTALSPIMITTNFVEGSGDSRSGGGFMTGDIGAGGNGFSGYFTVSGNRLIDFGAYGLAIAGGEHIIIEDNDLFSSINNPNIGNVNASVYVWRQGDEPPGDLYGCTVQNNRTLVWDNFSGQGAIIESGWCPTTGSDGLAPNHGTLAQGNVLPAGWSSNDWSYTAYDGDGGNAGYGLVRDSWKSATGRTKTDAWEYYAPAA